MAMNIAAIVALATALASGMAAEATFGGGAAGAAGVDFGGVSSSAAGANLDGVSAAGANVGVSAAGDPGSAGGAAGVSVSGTVASAGVPGGALEFARLPLRDRARRGLLLMTTNPSSVTIPSPSSQS